MTGWSLKSRCFPFFSLLLLALLCLAPALAHAQQEEETRFETLLRKANTEDDSDDLSEIEEPASCLDELGPKCHVVRIDAILIEGLARTRRYVVTRELLFGQGDYASLSQIEESITRLLNLGIFRDVTWDLVSQKTELADGLPAEQNPKRPARILKIRVDERWTLLPFFTLLQGGGLTRFATGGSDINLFGRYLTTGFQYDRLGRNETFLEAGGAANSFLVWFSNPRLGGTRYFGGIDLWRTFRLRSLYTPAGELQGGFSLERRMVVLRVRRELLRWLSAGMNVEFIDDSFTSKYIAQATRDAQQENFGGNPQGGRAIIARGNMRFGRVNQRNIYYDGWSLTQTLGHSDRLWGADYRFTQLETTLVGYKKALWRSNFAGRLRLGMTNSDQIQHTYYMGGLNSVRGYRDSQFRGSSYWAVNAEYRIAPIMSRWFVLQFVWFMDAGATADTLTPFYEVEAAALGAGARIILPKIYGFIGRLDWAYPLINGPGSGALSFGAQQFF